MTDEELGRAWCTAHGKRPATFGLFDRSGSNWVWRAGGPRYAGDPDPAATLPPLPLAVLPQTPDWTPNGYPSESAAYAAVGAALRQVWAFADESRKVEG